MIMNDRPDLARLAGCDGVHLGQEDVSVRDARRVLISAAHVGVSTHDRAQLDAAILAGASYLGVGPVFPSPTKEFSEPELAGLSFVQLAAESTALPWFAIGGIDGENVARVLETGATRIAVSGAVVRCPEPAPRRRPAQGPPGRPRSRFRGGGRSREGLNDSGTWAGNGRPRATDRVPGQLDGALRWQSCSCNTPEDCARLNDVCRQVAHLAPRYRPNSGT